MKKYPLRFLLAISLSAIAFLPANYLLLPPPVSAQTSPASFRFIAWADTKSDTNVLKNLSVQTKALNPVFTVYPGDLESSGFTQAGMDVWKNAVNGGFNNGMFDITFPVRGNHDNANQNPTAWQGYFNFASQISAIGGSNYSYLDPDLTYSFDYQNSRILGIDVPGNVTLMTSAQISWIDQRLTDAENKGLTHAFLYWHGPFYSEANHCCPLPPAELAAVFNKHPVVSATIHGHEHILTYTHINSSRDNRVTREFEQVITGDAGAGITVATSGKYDYAINLNGANVGGFVTVDVSGNSFTLTYYKGGTTAPLYTKTFTKGSIPNISNTPPPTVPPAGKPGDANADNKVDGLDYVIWLNNYNKPAAGAGKGDFNSNGLVDGLDYVIWLNNYNK